MSLAECVAQARELDGFHQQELHGEIGAITSAHRSALRDSMQQCGLHIKSLGTEMLLELKKKLDIVEAQRIFDGLREQWNSVDSRQKTLHMEMQAYADVSTELGNEVAAISLQAKGALNSAEQGYLVAPLESKVQRLEALVTELLQTQRSRDDVRTPISIRHAQCKLWVCCG
ncbi:hypothetical protein AB1Y20_000049 [Prymnesium parvum]|uniref:Uncharacterized protein n=1 Tax=Prymnesium parvum TaxID=97485 RepID=A0AB34K729_PRYPA